MSGSRWSLVVLLALVAAVTLLASVPSQALPARATRPLQDLDLLRAEREVDEALAFKKQVQQEYGSDVFGSSEMSFLQRRLRMRARMGGIKGRLKKISRQIRVPPRPRIKINTKKLKKKLKKVGRKLKRAIKKGAKSIKDERQKLNKLAKQLQADAQKLKALAKKAAVLLKKGLRVVCKAVTRPFLAAWKVYQKVRTKFMAMMVKYGPYLKSPSELKLEIKLRLKEAVVRKFLKKLRKTVSNKIQRLKNKALHKVLSLKRTLKAKIRAVSKRYANQMAHAGAQIKRHKNKIAQLSKKLGSTSSFLEVQETATVGGAKSKLRQRLKQEKKKLRDARAKLKHLKSTLYAAKLGIVRKASVVRKYFKAKALVARFKRIWASIHQIKRAMKKSVLSAGMTLLSLFATEFKAAKNKLMKKIKKGLSVALSVWKALQTVQGLKKQVIAKATALYQSIDVNGRVINALSRKLKKAQCHHNNVKALKPQLPNLKYISRGLKYHKAPMQVSHSRFSKELDALAGVGVKSHHHSHKKTKNKAHSKKKKKKRQQRRVAAHRQKKNKRHLKRTLRKLNRQFKTLRRRVKKAKRANKRELYVLHKRGVRKYHTKATKKKKKTKKTTNAVAAAKQANKKLSAACLAAQHAYQTKMAAVATKCHTTKGVHPKATCYSRLGSIKAGQALVKSKCGGGWHVHLHKHRHTSAAKHSSKKRNKKKRGHHHSTKSATRAIKRAHHRGRRLRKRSTHHHRRR